MSTPNAQIETVTAQVAPVVPRSSSPAAPIAPFLLGTAVGGLLGAIAGTLLANATRRLLFWVIHLAGRRLSEADRDRLRFEVLLQ